MIVLRRKVQKLDKTIRMVARRVNIAMEKGSQIHTTQAWSTPVKEFKCKVLK